MHGLLSMSGFVGNSAQGLEDSLPAVSVTDIHTYTHTVNMWTKCGKDYARVVSPKLSCQATIIYCHWHPHSVVCFELRTSYLSLQLNRSPLLGCPPPPHVLHLSSIRLKRFVSHIRKWCFLSVSSDQRNSSSPYLYDHWTEHGSSVCCLYWFYKMGLATSSDLGKERTACVCVAACNPFKK